MYSKAWSHCPSIYEINTRVWLADLSTKYGAFIELDSVPSAEWDAIAEFGLDAVWLMGVWERSAAGIAIANRNRHLHDDFRRALPEFQPRDNVGSPHCVRRYEVEELLGGPRGLAYARKELARRGMRLILDFIPNHVGPDHRWVSDHPEYFIQGTTEDATNDRSSYMWVEGREIALGRESCCFVWPDVLQLNAFHPGLRLAMMETVAGIASQCDGVRCHKASILEHPAFERTWRNRAGERPGKEYWIELISTIKRAYPDFLFIAEADGDRQWRLQQQGFAFCYDKGLYDQLEHGAPESVRLHLCADIAYQKKLVRFIENHGEPRAAATFSPAKERAAAIMMATLPGARLFHEGQFEGRKVRVPEFLGRRPVEFADEQLRAFYRKLLKTVANPLFHDSQWGLCERTGWPDNPNFQNLVAWSWTDIGQRCLVVVNLSDSPARARVGVPWNNVHGETWVLSDVLSGATFDQAADEIQRRGLYVDLGPWDCHLFRCYRSLQVEMAAAA
jgi:hypothetical protein